MAHKTINHSIGTMNSIQSVAGPRSAKRRGLTALAGITLAFFSHTGFTKNFYVENWGTGLECSKTNPCGLIQNAINIAGKNDRIIVGPGTYPNNLTIYQNQLTGEPLEGLKLESTAGRNATIIRASNENFHLLRVRQPRVVVGRRGKGFTFTGATGNDQAGIRVSSVSGLGFPSKIRIEGNRIGVPAEPGTGTHDNYFGIDVGQGGGKMQIRYNEITNNASLGINCTDCPDVLIRDNRIAGNGGSGLDLGGASGRTVVSDNLILNNGVAGLLSSLSSQDQKIRNNAVVLNGDEGIYLAGSDGSLTQGNIVTQNGTYGLFYLQGSPLTRTTVQHNLITDNDTTGAYFYQAEGLRFDNNSQIGNGTTGVLLDDLSNVASFRNNNIAEHSSCGLVSGGGIQPVFDFRKLFFEDNGADNCAPGAEGSLANKPNRTNVNKARKL